MSTLIFDSNRFQSELKGTRLSDWTDQLSEAVNAQEHALKHGHLPTWEQAVESLPHSAKTAWSMDDGVMKLDIILDDPKTTQLHKALEALIPWRKGPYAFGPVAVDTEWRSDWKWSRIHPHIQPLDNRAVLDVGCGNGYHLWAMRAAGANLVLGIDPSLHYLQQFRAVQHFAKDPSVQLLPLPMEALPENMSLFDTAFSMGVLYHRREPHGHLQELKQALRPGGELVLETLIIGEEEDKGLFLPGRYANMRNIYELPSSKRLERWIEESGFNSIKTVSHNQTSLEEQRSTAWMPNYSLQQALDPSDMSKTVEGHPRPLRAVVIAQA